jgi:hypothetical protein
MGGLIDGVERIAVLRANGLGDLMFALPAVCGADCNPRPVSGAPG